MIELVIFWGIPLIFMLMAAQSPFFQNWRFLLVISLAGYLALWCFPLFNDFFKAFLPKDISLYAQGITFVSSLTVMHIVLFQIACGLSSHGGNGYHLPREKNLLVPAMGLMSGFIVSGLVGYAVCLTPLHSAVAVDAVFQERAVNRVVFLTSVIDSLSLQSTSRAVRQKKLIARVTPWKKPVKSDKKDKKDDNSKKNAPAGEKKKSAKTSFVPGRLDFFSPASSGIKSFDCSSEKFNRKVG